MMKTIRNIFITLAITALAALAVSCPQPVESPVSGISNGRVVLTVSTGSGGFDGAESSVKTTARTIVPAGDYYFSRYELVLTQAGGDGSGDFTRNASGLDLNGGMENLELGAGDWTVTVRAYSTTNLINNTQREYLAAQGSTSFTVNIGAVTLVQVDIAPVPVETGASKGIFTYQINYPYGASGTLALIKNQEKVYNVNLPGNSGWELASAEIDPGYYDFFIELTNADGMSAWAFEKAHIYSGLESRAYFTFENEDFVQVTPLEGILSALPAGVSFGSGTVTAYSNPGYTAQTNYMAFTGGTRWFITVPVLGGGGTVYLKVETSGSDGKTYQGKGSVAINAAEAATGKRDIVLWDTTVPADVINLAAVPGSGEVQLTWTDPEDGDFDYVEISWNNESVTAPKSSTYYRDNSKTITGLTGRTEYTFTVRAVDTAGNKSGDVTVTAVPFDTADSVTARLNAASGGYSADDPASLAVYIDISNGWKLGDLLGVIQAMGRYVALDLSACSMNGISYEGSFNPGTANTGERYITSLVLPDAATSIRNGTDIGYSTFRHFINLQSVSGAYVQSVGSYAFEGCTALQEVSFPEATSIDYYAFYDCIALTTVSFPKVTYIGGYAFEGCTALQAVSFPEATYISYAAFYGTALQAVNFPKVTYIDNSAFYGTALQEVSLQMAETIGYGAFQNCTALTSVSLQVATSIGDYAFYGCTGLTTVTLPEATSIGYYAFEGCTALETVNLPAVTSISGEAFRECNTLTTVYLPVVEIIGGSAFSGTALTMVSLPAAKDIGYNAFYNCTVLTTVELPEAQIIGDSAFSDTALTTVSLPKATSIGNGAFSGCTSLQEVYLPVAQTIGGSAFSGTSLVTVSLPAATDIGYNSFYNCTALQEVYLPNATSIGGYAFYYCTALTTVSLPAAIEIGYSAFRECNTLTTVDLPMAETIGGYAFAYCYALKTVNLPEATDIGYDAFYNCYTLETVNLPAATSIGDYAFAFSGGQVLTVTLGSTAPTLGVYMFDGVSNKTVTVQVPTGATGYGSLPFDSSDITTYKWGNAFRGLGWDGMSYLSGTVNEYITLDITN